MNRALVADQIYALQRSLDYLSIARDQVRFATSKRPDIDEAMIDLHNTIMDEIDNLRYYLDN